MTERSGFEISDRARTRWLEMSDDAYPDFREAQTAPRRLMCELPRSGAGLWLMCCGCWTRRWVGGEEICRRWPAWLLRPQLHWAKSLRCQECGLRRFAVHTTADPGANGFQRGPEDTAPIVAARRLKAWLAGTGLSLEDVIDHLSAMPTRAALEALVD